MRRLRYRRRRAFIESYGFPSALRKKLREELDGGHRADVALEGLRAWYLACLEAPGQILGMPSRAVDVAWHEMILMTRIYHEFCRRAFGYYLHHSPEAVMEEPMREGLARTLSMVEANSLTVAGVPLLFAVDQELGLEDGQVWASEDIESLRQHDLHRSAGYYYAGGGSCAAVSGCSTAGSGCGGGG